MSKGNWANALETRFRWLNFSSDAEVNVTVLPVGGLADYGSGSLSFMNLILEKADTFYMNSKFASLVEHARQTIPGEMRFRQDWLLAPCGWMYFETPFVVGEWIELEADGDKDEAMVEAVRMIREASHNVFVSAIGWYQIGEEIVFTEFIESGLYIPSLPGYWSGSRFKLRDGDLLSDAEKKSTTKVLRVRDEHLNEIRLVYSVMYLINQKLSVSVPHHPDRHQRRRMVREGNPLEPVVKVITLRRLEEDRVRENKGSQFVDWQWQWEVRGHWRNQYLPSTGEHTPVFVEAYIKGPKDKPLKPPGLKLFSASR